MGEGFWKILFALWATCFIFCVWFVSNIILKPYIYIIHVQCISCIVVHLWQSSHWCYHYKVKVKGQSQLYSKQFVNNFFFFSE
jgi:hypothetical protein